MKYSIIGVAMHLSNVEPEHFINGSGKLRYFYEYNRRKLQASPTLSTASSSSGFNSLGTDEWSSTSSLAESPLRIMYNERNLLDLASNITWNTIPSSELPKNVDNFFRNRSQYSRVNEDMVPLHVDIACEDCEFVYSVF